MEAKGMVERWLEPRRPTAPAPSRLDDGDADSVPPIEPQEATGERSE